MQGKKVRDGFRCVLESIAVGTVSFGSVVGWEVSALLDLVLG